MATTTSRKVLVPLATLLAAGAVAVGSGATWTSTTSSSVAVTAGTLLHSNNHDGAVLTLTDIKPGDSMTGTVVVENTGTTNSTLDLAVTSATSSFSDYLTITVSEGATELYAGPLNDLAADFAQTDIDFDAADGAIPADSVTYTFTVELEVDTTGDADTQNIDQGETASAVFTWTQTQVEGQSLTENWVG